MAGSSDDDLLSGGSGLAFGIREQALADGADAATVRILKSYVEGAGVNLEFARCMDGIREFSVPVTVFDKSVPR